MRIGVVADVQQDIIHDGLDKLRYFMKDMNTRKTDFLIQLGDFVLPHHYNQPFLDLCMYICKKITYIFGNEKTIGIHNGPVFYSGLDRSGRAGTNN